MVAAIGFRFPADIGGYSSPAECEELYRLACNTPTDGVIVELGTYKGRSAISMAQSGRMVMAVDRFVGEDRYFFNGDDDHHEGRFSAALVRENAAKYGVNVWPIESDSDKAAEIYKQIGGRAVDMLFIDADHRYEGVKADFEAWEPLLSDDAILVFDDTLWPGVMQFILELTDWEPIPGPQVGGLTAMRRVRDGVQR